MRPQCPYRTFAAHEVNSQVASKVLIVLTSGKNGLKVSRIISRQPRLLWFCRPAKYYGDDRNVMGFQHPLRCYGFGGQITVIFPPKLR